MQKVKVEGAQGEGQGGVQGEDVVTRQVTKEENDMIGENKSWS